MGAPEGNQYALGNEGGRPTKFKPEFCEQVKKLCLLGATNKQIADFFEVTEETIQEWLRSNKEFSSSVKEGKVIADANVANSLYNRATGFVKENCEKVFQFQGAVIRAETKEYFPPDAGAAMNWLKNRQKDIWRDKVEFDLNTNIIKVVIQDDGDTPSADTQDNQPEL